MLTSIYIAKFLCLCFGSALGAQVAIDGFGGLTETMHMTYDFSKSTSAEMGKVCHDFVVQKVYEHNLPLLRYHHREGDMLLLTMMLCTRAAELQGLNFIPLDFVRTLYPHVRGNELTSIFDKYFTDKGSYHHNFGYNYHRYLSPYREVQGLRYLELGTHKGESLAAYREYFPLAERVVGIDLKPSSKLTEKPEVGIHVELGSQVDAEFLARVNGLHGPFDIIVDDASHEVDLTIRSFEILFPMLRNKGVYLVEDTGLMPGVADYFYALSRVHLRSKHDLDGGYPSMDPFKMNHKTDNVFEYALGDVVITNGCILVYKDIRFNWI